MILAILAMGIFLTGCELDNITQPEDAKWSVMTIAGDPGDSLSHIASVMWIGPANNYVAPNSIQLKIGGEIVSLTPSPYGGFWMGSLDLTPGSTYSFELIVNGETAVNTKQTIVNNADATFPLTFNPAATAYSYWTLTANNKTQTASAYAYDADPDLDEYADHDLTPSDREYTFPANVVQDHGMDAIYSLEITQMNHKYVDNVLVASAQSDWADYGDKKIDRFSPARLAKYVRHLSNLALR